MESGNKIMLIGGILAFIIGIGWCIITMLFKPVDDLNWVVFQCSGIITILLGIGFGTLLIGSAYFKYK